MTTPDQNRSTIAHFSMPLPLEPASLDQPTATPTRERKDVTRNTPTLVAWLNHHLHHN